MACDNIDVQRPQPAPTPDDLRTRLKELAPFANDNVVDQHLVSRVILRRYARPVPKRQGRVLARLNLYFPDAGPTYKAPAGCGKEPNFLKVASRLAEDLWATVENQLHDALAACDDGTLFDRPELVEVIKDAIALHFVRSNQTMALHERAWTIVRDEYRMAWLDDRRMLELAHYLRTGLYTAAPAVLEATADDLIAPIQALVDSGEMLRVRIEQLFEQARDIARKSGLEIARPEAGEFIIGDTPALAVRNDRPGIGPLDGIAMNDANLMVLPLGPRLLASLGPADTFGTVSADFVDRMNGLQVAAARKYVYFRPGSGMEGFVRQACAAGARSIHRSLSAA